MTQQHETFTLSYVQAENLESARREGVLVVIAPVNLGTESREVRITESGVQFSDSVIASWDAIQEIREDRKCCFEIDAEGVRPIRGFSSATDRALSLFPTQGAPALMLGGFLMHRIKDTDPYTSAKLMVQAVAPIRGHVLDTATGLGYAAIEAAKSAGDVTTIELDPAVREMARRNPWSRPLFENPRISLVEGDSFVEIARFAAEKFSCVIHDPPTLSLGGELYSTEFYRQVWRVLTKKGRLFHYIGDPKSSSGGRTTGSVSRRLMDAGFRKIQPAPAAHGVIALK